MKLNYKNYKSKSIQISSGDASRVLSTKRLIYVYCYINIHKNYRPIKYYISQYQVKLNYKNFKSLSIHISSGDASRVLSTKRLIYTTSIFTTFFTSVPLTNLTSTIQLFQLPDTRHPSPATRHLSPATRHPPPATRHPWKSAAALMLVHCAPGKLSLSFRFVLTCYEKQKAIFNLVSTRPQGWRNFSLI